MSDLAFSTPPGPPPALRFRLPRRRPRLRGWFAKGHRWTSFALGLLLLVIVISGVVLLFEPEIEQVTRPSLYDTDPGPARIAPGQALATVHREMPSFDTAEATVWRNRGAWEVHGSDGETVRVDDSDGRLLGSVDREHGVMGFIANLHECALGCEEMSGYVPFLGKPAQIGGADLTLGNEGTWGGLILLVSGVVLLLLVVSGLVLWWPGRRRWRRGFNLRRRGGSYRLNYDLHKVGGFVALPFLAMWAITGINFELPKQTEAAWYAVTPGSPQPESDFEFESKPGSGAGPEVTMAAAIAGARRAVPAGSTLEAVNNPNRGEETSYYELWFSHGADPWTYGYYPGNYGVYVDRHSGRAVRFWPNPANDSVTSGFWQNWTGTLHMGNVVGWIPRLGWLGFGLTPLLLAFTGVATWLLRRRLRWRRNPGGGNRPGGSAPGGIAAPGGSAPGSDAASSRSGALGSRSGASDGRSGASGGRSGGLDDRSGALGGGDGASVGDGSAGGDGATLAT